MQRNAMELLDGEYSLNGPFLISAYHADVV
jgi:hypothetical protein